jgi:hypothetical protein
MSSTFATLEVATTLKQLASYLPIMGAMPSPIPRAAHNIAPSTVMKKFIPTYIIKIVN